MKEFCEQICEELKTLGIGSAWCVGYSWLFFDEISYAISFKNTIFSNCWCTFDMVDPDIDIVDKLAEMFYEIKIHELQCELKNAP